jgi:hypothetical protein
MSLRAADFIFDSNKLIIKAKTKIAFNQISDNDSISRINEGLEKLGYSSIDLKVE